MTRYEERHGHSRVAGVVMGLVEIVTLALFAGTVIVWCSILGGW